MDGLTGRRSKLAKLVEEAIREQLAVEIELSNGEVIYGTVHSYELSHSQFIIAISTPKNVVVINFNKAVRMRVQHGTSSNFAPQSEQ